MKRLSCLLLGILLVFSLCACQQAAPSSGEAPDQQAITEEATEYFNQMMDGDFETFFNALPQGVQDNISAETIQETWEEEVDKLGGCRRTLPRMCPAMCRNTLTKSVLNLSFLVAKAISKYSSTISRMAAFTTMLSGRTKQNEKARYFYE
mgnify:CR=1 FL=1